MFGPDSENKTLETTKLNYTENPVPISSGVSLQSFVKKFDESFATTIAGGAKLREATVDKFVPKDSPIRSEVLNTLKTYQELQVHRSSMGDFEQEIKTRVINHYNDLRKSDTRLPDINSVYVGLLDEHRKLYQAKEQAWTHHNGFINKTLFAAGALAGQLRDPINAAITAVTAPIGVASVPAAIALNGALAGFMAPLGRVERETQSTAIGDKPLNPLTDTAIQAGFGAALGGIGAGGAKLIGRLYPKTGTPAIDSLGETVAKAQSVVDSGGRLSDEQAANLSDAKAIMDFWKDKPSAVSTDEYRNGVMAATDDLIPRAKPTLDGIEVKEINTSGPTLEGIEVKELNEFDLDAAIKDLGTDSESAELRQDAKSVKNLLGCLVKGVFDVTT